jgi:hypothetical protein
MRKASSWGWVSFLVTVACGGGRPGGPATASPPIPPTATAPAATPPPTPVPAAVVSPVQLENQRAGGDGWQLHHRAPVGMLEGYTGATSVQHGEALDFHVRADGPHSMSWSVWRMGWYGGVQGRLVASGGPVHIDTQVSPSPTTTGLLECHWPVTFTVQTDASWTSGIYMAKLVRDDGFDAHVPFVVRADERKGVGVFQASFTTYQAYNAWGGLSLYDGSPPAVEVSFDRPFIEGSGAGQYFWFEHYFVIWAESRGFDLTYLTNVDVDRDPSLLLDQRLFLSVGHDEYWSRNEREAVEAALAAGTNLAFFSANSATWQIRLEPSRADGRRGRTQVCWKRRSHTEDPLRGTPLETTMWRSPPLNQPESELLGVEFTAWEFRGGERVSGDSWIVAGSTAWPYEGTGVKDGDVIPGIVGYETDRTDASTPHSTVVLARSPVIDVSGRSDVQEGAVRDVASGAFVFAAGTMEWSWGLSKPGIADQRVQRITENVLRRAGLEPG